MTSHSRNWQEKWELVSRSLGEQPAVHFRPVLEKSDDWALRRINPIRFAKSHGFTESETTDFFLHAARVGLFDFSWAMVCPSCGEIQNEDGDINAIQGDRFHCNICRVDVPIVVDDNVEVTFTVNPSVREVNWNPYENPENYRRYFFSDNFERSQELLDHINAGWLGFVIIDAGRQKTLRLQLKAGGAYRLVLAEIHSQCVFRVSNEARQISNPTEYEVTLTEDGFSQDIVTIQTRNPRITIRNEAGRRVGIMAVGADFDTLHQIMRDHPARRLPFLTGKMLLNNQTFRDLFRLQNLSPSLRFNIRSLTLLFTDLKGSTEMYDSTGDVAAYQLIQRHFKLLTGIVRKYNGAIIKTMGDAIMASFSSPGEGVRAAIEMLKAMDEVRYGSEPLGLKVGLHEGTALAISNEGRLDYFGQTVNIAARVQGLAAAGELWITDAVHDNPEVHSVIHDSGLNTEMHSVSLKGIGTPSTVYRIQSYGQSIRLAGPGSE